MSGFVKFILAGVIYCGVAFPVAANAQTPDTLQPEGPVPFDAVPADAASPFGGVSISPTRVVLEGGQRSDQVTLYNSGNKPVTYRIETVDMVPLRQGGYAMPVEGAAQPDWSAAPLLRYAPRQVTLQGGERQVIKILSRARRDTAPAEYRTHMRFSTIPLVEDVSDADSAQSEATDSKTVSVSVGLEYRITIPVILRVGELSNGTEIKAASVEVGESGTAEVAVTLARQGEASDYARIRLLDSNDVEIGLLKGVSVLPPLTERIVRVPVKVAGARPAKVVLETNPVRGDAELLSDFIMN